MSQNKSHPLTRRRKKDTDMPQSPIAARKLDLGTLDFGTSYVGAPALDTSGVDVFGASDELNIEPGPQDPFGGFVL
jgi:hypothetical protein